MPQPEDDRLTITVDEAARVLGVSRATAYAAAHSYLASGGTEGLPVIKLGRRLLVPNAALRQLLGAES